MTVCHVSVLEETLQKTHEWLRELEMIASLHNQSQAYSALRAVLHVLRDRLVTDEAADLAAQLPMLVRGIYYEGWKPAVTPSAIRTRQQFVDAVKKQLGPNTDIEAEVATQAVFALLSNHVARGEIRDVRHMLPKSVRELWPVA